MKSNPSVFSQKIDQAVLTHGREPTRGSLGSFMAVLSASAFVLSGCSEESKKEEAKKVEPPQEEVKSSPAPTTPAAPVATATGYRALNSDAEDGLWTGLRGVRETVPSAGLTFRVQAIEGDAGREAVAKDLAAKLKNAGFESVYETVKADGTKPSGSALVKCHFTRAQITEKVFAVVGRHYIGGQFEMRSDDDTSKQETVITLYAKPVFSEEGRVTFE